MHHEPLATLIGAIMHGKNTYNQKIRVDEIVRVKILHSVHIDIPVPHDCRAVDKCLRGEENTVIE